MKTIGIIGGLGPETTSKFYLELVFLCKKLNKIHYPDILINSVPLPFAIERTSIIQAKNTKKCLPFLLDAARKLEKAGADFLVLPCNSLHIFIEDIRKAVNVPVLSILEETAKFLKAREIKRVGIIGTEITIKNRLYEETLIEHNIKCLVPDDSLRDKIGVLIHNLVSQKHSRKDKNTLLKIINNLSNRNVKHIILACTDLQLLLPKVEGVKIYDTMKILAHISAKYMNK